MINEQKILLVGNGFIGSNLNLYLSKKKFTYLTNKKELDVLSKDSINNFFLNNSSYTHIIYCAGIKDVRYCEKNEEQAFLINSKGVENILDVANKQKFIYLSTDYVFNGADGNYLEDSPTNPQTAYGRSKLAGEKSTLLYENSLVIRTSGVYGKGCKWLDDLLQNLKNKNKIVCFSDVYNTPTYVDNLGEMILDVIEFKGIINLSGFETYNRYDLYKEVASSFNFEEKNLISGFCDILIPKNLSLNTDKYKKITNNKQLKNFKESMQDLKRKMYEN
jgi:dTDP-4-dehydrorhamnose reductase